LKIKADYESEAFEWDDGEGLAAVEMGARKLLIN
jgi:hypothetical protein